MEDGRDAHSTLLGVCPEGVEDKSVQRRPDVGVAASATPGGGELNAPRPRAPEAPAASRRRASGRWRSTNGSAVSPGTPSSLAPAAPPTTAGGSGGAGSTTGSCCPPPRRRPGRPTSRAGAGRVPATAAGAPRAAANAAAPSTASACPCAACSRPTSSRSWSTASRATSSGCTPRPLRPRPKGRRCSDGAAATSAWLPASGRRPQRCATTSGCSAARWASSPSSP
mmetsp:Transcript_35566/g.101273  ORF Transcript_35566/g.101273 Transcript_35566/m.101273 type:complete len:225 (-) Transcript_35566:204-878(-)